MSESLRIGVLANLMTLVHSDPGWDAYTLAEAAGYERDMPDVHNGLTAAIESEIGPERTKHARKALEWFASNPAEGVTT